MSWGLVFESPPRTSDFNVSDGTAITYTLLSLDRHVTDVTDLMYTPYLSQQQWMSPRLVVPVLEFTAMVGTHV